MFAPDPIFFYAYSRMPPHAASQSKVPYFVTNKGLSITLPTYNPFRGGQEYRGTLGERLRLAMLTEYHGAIDPGDILGQTEFRTGVATFLGVRNLENKIYERDVPSDYDFDDLTPEMFRGFLMGIRLPTLLFHRYFQPSPIFVRGSPYEVESVFSRDRTPKVAIWILNYAEADSVPRIAMLQGAGRVDGRRQHDFGGLSPWLLEGAVTTGAIYTVSCAAPMQGDQGKTAYYKEYVLVRALKPEVTLPGLWHKDDKGFNDASIRWRCERLDRVPVWSSNRQQEVPRWKFKGQHLTLSEILSLDVDPFLFGWESRCPLRAFPTKQGTRQMMACLEGRAFWFNDPMSSMRFLHVEM
ncbi:hypothetical protein QBC47DRAFT_366904, partial [Echria macrotheca]